MSKHLYLCFLLVLVAISGGYSQEVHNPMSLYGLGDFLEYETVNPSSTGWNSNVFMDRHHISLLGPASYGYLQSTSFEIGLSAKYDKWDNSETTYKSWSGKLNYLSLAFPIFSHYNDILEKKERKFTWGMGFALSPYSQVSYNFLYSAADPNTGQTAQLQTGKGGTYKLYWNNGIAYKGVAFGLGAQYLFGKIERNKQINFLDYSNDLSYVTVRQNETFLRGLLWNFALHYSHIFNPITEGKKTDYDKERKLSGGLTFQPLSKLRSNINETNYRYNIKLSDGLSDTISSIQTDKQKNDFNSVAGLGIQYQQGLNWKININYDMSFYGQYDVGLDADYKNAAMLKIGGEYCPDPNSYVSFFRRAKYRAGLRTGTHPTVVDDHQSKVTAGIVGMGLPIFVNRQVSFVNAGLEIGNRQFTEKYTDTYFKLSLGFNINDDYWFLKKKFK